MNDLTLKEGAARLHISLKRLREGVYHKGWPHLDYGPRSARLSEANLEAIRLIVTVGDVNPRRAESQETDALTPSRPITPELAALIREHGVDGAQQIVLAARRRRRRPPQAA